MKKQELENILKLINNHDVILIFMHINPDGDCIGASQGLFELIKLNFPNKKVYSIGTNKNLFSFLNFSFTNINDLLKEEINSSLAIIVDANFSNRIQEGNVLVNKQVNQILRIDHHDVGDDLDCTYRLVDPTFSSSCEQIVELAKKAKWKINKEIATYLYLGIYTDSNRFFYDKTTKRTFDLVSYLYKINKSFFPLHLTLSKRTIEEIKFQQDVYKNFKTLDNIIYYVLPLSKQKKLNLNTETNNRVDFLANIEGFDIWIFFIEQEDHTYRVRFRSKNKDVNKLASLFGGGGHKKASGAIIKNKNQIIKVLNEALKI